MEPNTTTAGSTGAGSGVNPTPDASLVNSAQSQATTPVPGSQTPVPGSQTSLQTQDPNYQQRINDLMSAKDKALAEAQRLTQQYNEAIAAQVELQRQKQELEAKSATTLSTAAQSAQDAINRQKQLEAQVAQLQAENMRARLLVEKPHLAPYMQFIPATTDEAQLKQAVEQFEQIRAKDLDANRFPNTQGQQIPGQPQQAFPLQQQQQTPSQPLPTPQDTMAALYGSRPTMAPIPQVPGSNPSLMNPMGAATNSIDAIAALYEAAKASGEPGAYERAHAQAIALANSQLATFRAS